MAPPYSSNGNGRRLSLLARRVRAKKIFSADLCQGLELPKVTRVKNYKIREDIDLEKIDLIGYDKLGGGDADLIVCFFLMIISLR